MTQVSVCKHEQFKVSGMTFQLLHCMIQPSNFKTKEKVRENQMHFDPITLANEAVCGDGRSPLEVRTAAKPAVLEWQDS